MNLLDLCIRTIVQLSQQQIIHKMYRDTGYIFTIKMTNDQTIPHYTHIIVTGYPSVFILVNTKANWRELEISDWSHAANTSNHNECWKSSGFVILEDFWDKMKFNSLEFHTGNFGFKMYEEVRITKTPNGLHTYGIMNIQPNE